MTSPIITNSCTHSSIFIQNTLKVHVKFTPTCFGSQMEPSSEGQQLILATVSNNVCGPFTIKSWTPMLNIF